MAEKHLRKCSAFLAIKEIQIKTTLRFQPIPVRMAKISKTNDSQYWQGCGVMEHSPITGKSENLYNHCGNQYDSSSEDMN